MERIINDGQMIFLKNGEEIARIKEELQGDIVEMTLCGSFSGDLANDLFDEMIALVTTGKGIELNLGRVTYLASSINRVLLAVENKLEQSGKTMRMVHVPEQVFKDFKAKGMHELFEMELER